VDSTALVLARLRRFVGKMALVDGALRADLATLRRDALEELAGD